MRKLPLLVPFVFLGALNCGAQGLRSWTSGPLSWSDFQSAGPELSDSSETSHASFSLIRENIKVKEGGIAYKYQDVSAAIDPRQSWVEAAAKNEQTLRKLLQEFDILQYYATLYREDFMFYTDMKNHPYEEYFDEGTKHKLSEAAYLEQYRSAIEEFRKTGDASAYPVSREPFDITKMPCQVASGASEMHISLITVNPTGDLAKMFTPVFGFSAGYGYREGRNYVCADLSEGVIGLNLTGYSFKDGGHYTVRGSYFGAAAKYGRILFSAGKTDFSLFAGLGYSAWKEGHLLSKATVSGLTLTEGLCVDYTFHRTFNYLAKTPQARDFGLQFKVYVDELYVASQKFFVPTINLGMGFNFGFRKLSRI